MKKAVLKTMLLALLALFNASFSLALTCGGNVSCPCYGNLTSSYTMDADLVDCPMYGIIVSASNVFLDCAGHTIGGDATNGPFEKGVDVNNRQNVTVRNCRITGFTTGINVDFGLNTVLQSNILDQTNNNSIMVMHSRAVIIEHSDIQASPIPSRSAVTLNQVKNSTIRGNLIHDSWRGIFVYAVNTNTTGNNITENIITRNSEGITLTQDIFSIVNTTTVWNNTFANNSQNAMENGSSQYGVIKGNFWDNGTDGNYWDDLESNPGYNDSVYIIPGPGDGVDHHPSWQFPNRPPVLQPIGSRDVATLHLLTIDVNATDPDNDPLVYGTNAAGVLPSPSTFDAETGVFQWTPRQGDYGEYDVTFNVTDGTFSDYETVHITVCEGQCFACGQTITQDSVLGNSLYNCTGNGIIIGADGIELDCKGRMIIGVDAYDTSGVILPSDYPMFRSGVTVRNCDASRFYYGIFGYNSRNSTIANNSVHANVYGLAFLGQGYGADMMIVQDNVAANNIIGIIFAFENSSQMTGNRARGNSIGIRLQYVERNTFAHNVVENNTFGSEPHVGILLENGNDNAFLFNDILHNPSGVSVQTGAFKQALPAADARGNRERLYTSTHNLFANNRFMQNDLGATEDAASISNDWNESAHGNYWSDFAQNPGHPSNYTIPGEGDGVDYHPLCADGTPNFQCSSPKPKYCSGGVIVNNCQACGCPFGNICEPTGNCRPRFLKEVTAAGSQGGNA